MKRKIYLPTSMAVMLTIAMYFLSSVINPQAGFSQTPKKIYFNITNAEAGDVHFRIVDAVAVDNECKFKLMISNTGSNYYLFNASETVLLIDGKAFSCNEKSLIVEPLGNDYKVINFKGNGFNQSHQFTLRIEGLYKTTLQGSVMEGLPFALPPVKNNFQAGPFKYELKTDKRASSGSNFVFDVTYIGDDVGIIRPTYAALKMPTGSEFKNEESDKKPILLIKNETCKLKMQWAGVPRKEGDQQVCPMQLIWHETAMDASTEKMTVADIVVDWDERRSK